MKLLETAHLQTDHGSRYLQQLCKHFAHKVTVDYDASSGRVDLPSGPARMTADATGLSVEITAEDEDGLVRARHIIDDHLKRFAHRESFAGLDWHKA